LSEVVLLSQLTHLDVGDNQLRGTIPEALYGLTNLESLYLLQNSLTGTLSSGLANLTNLQYLLLNNNQLHGTIPAEIGSTQCAAGVVRPLRKFQMVLSFHGSLVTHTPFLATPRQVSSLDVRHERLAFAASRCNSLTSCFS
jgi:Leucine-rich repeat (LRR) protein